MRTKFKLLIITVLAVLCNTVEAQKPQWNVSTKDTSFKFETRRSNPGSIVLSWYNLDATDAYAYLQWGEHEDSSFIYAPQLPDSIPLNSATGKAVFVWNYMQLPWVEVYFSHGTVSSGELKIVGITKSR